MMTTWTRRPIDSSRSTLPVRTFRSVVRCVMSEPVQKSNQFEWNDDRSNAERLCTLQGSDETRWAGDGVIIIGDTGSDSTDEEDSSEEDWINTYTVSNDGPGENGVAIPSNREEALVYTQYADEKTSYPLGIKRGDSGESRIERAKALVEDAHEIGVPADTYIFDASYCTQELVEAIESHGSDWISLRRHDCPVEYDGGLIRLDMLHERVETTERSVEGEPYHIWTKKLMLPPLGEKKLLIAESYFSKSESSLSSVPETNGFSSETESDESPILNYFITNKIDAPADYLIRTYNIRHQVETSLSSS